MRQILDRLHRDERGSVLVVVAGFLPIAVLLAAWVIDLGNGAEHRRQLQLQADAGALAAAKEFDRCATNPDAANADMYEIAEDYATGRNVQVGGDRAGDVEIVLNDGAPVDSAGAPCGTGWIDVKLTEVDSPAFFGFVGSHDWPAHARVQALRVNRLAGMLPLGVPSPEPRTAWAIFFTEGSPSTTLATVELKSTGYDDDLDLSLWETEDPAAVPIQSPHVGVRIAFSGGTTAPTNCDPPVTCFWGDTALTKGLVHIQGWDPTAAQQQTGQDGLKSNPVVQKVSLDPLDSSDPLFCADDRFLPSFSPATPSCLLSKRNLAITTHVDFGGPASAVGGKVAAVVGNTTTAFVTPDANNNARWVVSIPSAGGELPIGIKWTATKGKIPGGDTCTPDKPNKPCEGEVLNLQRHFRTSALSGPIELMQVTGAGGTDANAFARNTSASLDVKIGIAGTLQADGPLQTLRLGGVNRTGSLDCDPSIPNFKGELGSVLGCPEYTVNEGTPCPDNTPPLACVPVETGNTTNQIPAGLNEKILGEEKPKTCPPLGSPGHNNYSLVQAGTPVEGDKRFVVLFLTRFGALDGTGQTQVPITGFARFYITGWNGSGGGFDNPCQGNGDDPAADAEIVGYFLNYVKTPNEGGGSTEPCDFDAIKPCTPVLVD